MNITKIHILEVLTNAYEVFPGGGEMVKISDLALSVNMPIFSENSILISKTVISNIPILSYSTMFYALDGVWIIPILSIVNDCFLYFWIMEIFQNNRKIKNMWKILEKGLLQK